MNLKFLNRNWKENIQQNLLALPWFVQITLTAHDLFKICEGCEDEFSQIATLETYLEPTCRCSTGF